MLDELLEMSRKMKERLEQLQVDQAEVIDRLSKGVGTLRNVVNAAGEVVKAH